MFGSSAWLFSRTRNQLSIQTSLFLSRKIFFWWLLCSSMWLNSWQIFAFGFFVDLLFVFLINSIIDHEWSNKWIKSAGSCWTDNIIAWWSIELNRKMSFSLLIFFQLRRRRLEKFSSGSTSKSQTSSSNVPESNDKQVSTQLSDELASQSSTYVAHEHSWSSVILACQINSQQSNPIEDTNMDVGELTASEFFAASGEQKYARFFLSKEFSENFSWKIDFYKVNIRLEINVRMMLIRILHRRKLQKQIKSIEMERLKNANPRSVDSW